MFGIIPESGACVPSGHGGILRGTLWEIQNLAALGRCKVHGLVNMN
jgi:hypothetical protein